MVLGKYRDKFHFFIEGPAKLCVKIGITPNQLSFVAFLSSLLGAVCFSLPKVFFLNYHEFSPQFFFWWGWVPLIMFGIGSYIDVLDGTVARKTDAVSPYGGFLDSTLDRLSDGFVILGLVVGRMIWPWDDPTLQINSAMGLIALLIVLMISYVRSRAEVEGVPMQGVGFMERPERTLFIVGSYLFAWIVYCIQTQYLDGWTTEWIFPTLFLIFLVLCLFTLIVRIVHVFKWLGKKKTSDSSEQ